MDEFIELAASKIDHLTAPYISKSQVQYFKFRKNNLPANTAIVLAGFAEKYSSVIQDEVQGYHWTKQQYTLHLIVMYIKGSNLFFFFETFWSFFAETFLSLKHFDHLSHSCVKIRCNSVF